MTFPLNIYLLTTLAAAMASFCSLPLWRRWCGRAGLVDDPGARKIHDRAVPLAGGFAVLTGLLVPLLLGAAALWLGWLDAESLEKLGHGFDKRALQVAVVLAGALGMAWLGWLDDKHELRPAPKFAGQLLMATLVAAAGVRITLFVPSVLFSYLVTVLWILTLTNALNFMDNMNGLCAGVGAIAAGFFAATAAGHGQYLVAAIACLTAGALLGFLPHNFPRASAFLGDAGSQLTGYLLAVLGILPHFYSAKHPNKLAVISPLLILAVPLFDLVWVVLLRLWRGQPFYVGDTNHLSHRLVRRGLSPVAAVVLLWLLALASGLVALVINR